MYRTIILAEALYQLRNLKVESELDKEKIANLIRTLQVCILNHATPHYVDLLGKKMQSTSAELKSEAGKLLLSNLSATMAEYHKRDVNAPQNMLEAFNNPLGRNLESQISTGLLFKPTKKMLDSTKQLSLRIAEILDKSAKSASAENKHDIDRFLTDLGNSSEAHKNSGPYYLPSSKPELKEVISLLNSDNPKDFGAIMRIHFLFARDLYRSLADCKMEHKTEPVGALAKWCAKKIAGTNKTSIEFLSDLKKEDRIEYIDQVIAQSSVMSDRGRFGTKAIAEGRDTFGIMLEGQDESSLPSSMHTWEKDADFQRPYFLSKFVRESLLNEIPYVAGASGMTNLLLGIMDLVGNKSTELEKREYLLACMAYISGCGLHSIHEVLNIAQDALGLVPDYHKAMTMAIALEGIANYEVFFKNFVEDDSFAEVMNIAWENFLYFYKKHRNELLESIKETVQATVDEKQADVMEAATSPPVLVEKKEEVKKEEVKEEVKIEEPVDAELERLKIILKNILYERVEKLETKARDLDIKAAEQERKNPPALSREISLEDDTEIISHVTQNKSEYKSTNPREVAAYIIGKAEKISSDIATRADLVNYVANLLKDPIVSSARDSKLAVFGKKSDTGKELINFQKTYLQSNKSILEIHKNMLDKFLSKIDSSGMIRALEGEKLKKCSTFSDCKDWLRGCSKYLRYESHKKEFQLLERRHFSDTVEQIKSARKSPFV